MSTTTTHLSTAERTELMQLLQTAFPMHWENRVRNLGISPGRDLPPAELARVTERVFWMVRQTGMKDPAAWLAYRAQLEAARVKPETLPKLAAAVTLQRDKFEASKLRVDTAKTFDESLPISANRTTKVEPLSRVSAGDVLPEGTQMAPPIDRPTAMPREISSRSSNLSAARALRRGAGPIPPCSTTIRSTPVLFFLSSAREMAAALCPFFHRSHSSAFCAAVNQIRDVTMAHLLTS